MLNATSRPAAEGPTVDQTIGEHAAMLSSQIQAMSEALFPPTSKKALRRFTSGEAARLLGISDSTLRKMSLAGEGPTPETVSNGRRLYTLGQINEIRQRLAGTMRGRDATAVLPRRSGSEHLQIIAVANFKGGSGKTTTAAHLAQYFGLHGYRTLAVDLDPQASLSALFGVLPETDVGSNETLYAAIRYDAERKPLKEVILRTYFDGVDLVPGNLELMEYEHTTPVALTSNVHPDGGVFFTRVARAFDEVADQYDVVVMDCPPQLGFLTLSGLCAATGLLVTVHPQMLDVASMSQFLLMTEALLSELRNKGAVLKYDFVRYLLTRFEQRDGTQPRVAAHLGTLFGDHVLTNPMVKSTAVSDAGLSKQTLYEIGRENMTRATYDRALEALDAVNGEVESLVRAAWGRT